ncbi:MAG TPA: hypothetical protein VGE39_02855, partial [Prosthecobacter sp.]
LNGAKMVQMTNFFVEDDQMLRSVVAYIMTLNPEPVVVPQVEEVKSSVHDGSPFRGTKAK